MSEAGLRFISLHEGIRLNLYNDPAGHCTIGVGHLVHYGNCNGSEPAEFSAGISEQRAYEILRADVNTAVQAVKNLVRVPLNQQQFDALVSFTFNLGVGNLQSSDLLARLNAGEYSAVPYELSRWVYGGGVKLPGLVRRRNEEGILFRDGIYTGVSNPPVTVTPPPTSIPSPTGNLNWVNFSGTVGPSLGVNLRYSNRFSDRSSQNEPYGKTLQFDAWTYGEVGTNMWLGTPDARWFKVKGTNLWVPSAYIYGNPPNSSPMPGGSNNSSGGNNNGSNSEPPLFSNPTSSNPLRGFQDPLRGAGSISQFPSRAGNYSHTIGSREEWAIDFGVPIGTPVYAMRSGKVVGLRDIYPDTGGGSENLNKFNYVLIEHDGGYRSAYLHLQQGFISQAGISVGDSVTAGQLIGYSGNSGWSTNPHLHVEVQKPNNGYFGQTYPFEIAGRFNF